MAGITPFALHPVRVGVPMLMLIPPVAAFELAGDVGIVPELVVLVHASVRAPILKLRLLLEAVTAWPAGVTTVEAKAVPAATATAAAAVAAMNVLRRNVWGIYISLLSVIIRESFLLALLLSGL
ncbi:hypothetical protein [Rhodococcus erythropolis]|uniref:Uncharacterized protein n=1 Tax=Rhodococcus erythropolis TaxID=1833 RepID=A0AAX3ZYX1_RHOER|nr:hypothetical protein [Rhodococcus erythropolis]WMN02138.1 hypothetical protein QIE55_32940 [Rhodococcus erythropolis]WMN03113.1 hypothetical protein QIE55_32430 [Rhodococcus erythropolis]